MDPLAVPSDHDPCRLLGGVVGGDSNSDGFKSAKFWKDFDHAWQKVLDPQAHIESGCLWPPQTCVHRCHLNPVALVLRRGAAAIQVVQGDDVGTCRKTDVVCHHPECFQELMMWHSVKGRDIYTEMVLVTEAVKPVGVVDIVVVTNRILTVHQTKCVRECSELLCELQVEMCSSILINGVEHSVSQVLHLNDADVVEFCIPPNVSCDATGPPAVSGKNEGTNSGSQQTAVRPVVLPISDDVDIVTGPPAVSGKEQACYITTVFVEDVGLNGHRCDVATCGTWSQHQAKFNNSMADFQLVPVNWQCCVHAHHDVWLAKTDEEGGGSSVLLIYHGETLFADCSHVRACGMLSRSAVDMMCQGQPWEWVVYNGILLTALDIINEVFEIHDGDVVCCGTRLTYPALMAGFLLAGDKASCPGDRWCAESAINRDPANGLEYEGEKMPDDMLDASVDRQSSFHHSEYTVQQPPSTSSR